MRSMTLFHLLPVELTDQIIDYLTLDEVKNLRLVCHVLAHRGLSWRMLVHMAREDLHLTHKDLHRFAAISRHPVCKAAIKRITIVADVVDMSIVQYMIRDHEDWGPGRFAQAVVSNMASQLQKRFRWDSSLSSTQSGLPWICQGAYGLDGPLNLGKAYNCQAALRARIEEQMTLDNDQHNAIQRPLAEILVNFGAAVPISVQVLVDCRFPGYYCHEKGKVEALENVELWPAIAERVDQVRGYILLALCSLKCKSESQTRSTTSVEFGAVASTLLPVGRILIIHDIGSVRILQDL